MEKALGMMHELSLDMHPDTFTLRYNLAMCYEAMGDDEMRAEAERLIKLLEIRGMAEEAQEIRDMTSK